MKKHYAQPMINFIGMSLDDVICASSVIDGQDNLIFRPTDWIRGVGL